MDSRIPQTSSSSENSRLEPRIPARYVLAVLAFFGFFNLYALRVNLSVAIVDMVNASSSATNVEDNSTDVCPGIMQNMSEPTTPPLAGSHEFNWDTTIQGIILSSFFYGSICTQIFGGWLSRKFGGKHPYGLSVFVSGFLSLFIPLAAHYHYSVLIAIRVLQGLFQGMSFPSMHTMMGRWGPPLERSQLLGVAYAGVEIGTVVSLFASGILTQYLGWESVFYVFGGAACLWYIFWLAFAFDTPEGHPYITSKERFFIVSSLNAQDGAHDAPFPWKKAAFSLPVWALCVAHFGHNWGYYTLLTNIPTYLDKILHFDIENNGLLSALPFFVTAITITASGFIADSLRKRRCLSTTWVRRIFHLIGQFVPAISLVVLGYVGCNAYAVISLLTLAVGADGITGAGFQVNHVDVSPTHAGILMGLSNTFGTIPGIVGPYLVGILTEGELESSLTQWRLIFLISAGVYVLTSLFYCVFASGELEQWEVQEDDSDLLVPGD